MYDEAMDGIHQNLVMHTPKRGLQFIAELMPEKDKAGNLCVLVVATSPFSFSDVYGLRSWRREPKQDHLVCFLAGSLMLGATSTLGKHDPSFLGLADPENELENERSKRDWKSGDQLLKTCWETHRTGTYVAHLSRVTESRL